jgi:hypothetical protein
VLVTLLEHGRFAAVACGSGEITLRNVGARASFDCLHSYSQSSGTSFPIGATTVLVFAAHTCRPRWRSADAVGVMPRPDRQRGRR